MVLSIIIPVYNSFAYLNLLLDQLRLQADGTIEILLIDDGSEKINLWESIENNYKDEQIRLIHKNHGGVSSARNLGIDLARGEYIWFIDSDDLVDRHAISNILRHTLCDKKPDVLFLNHRKFSKDGFISLENTALDKMYIKKCDSDLFLNYIYSNNSMMCGVWSFVFRKAVIDRHQHRFNESLRIYEDVDWIIQIILWSQQFCYIPDPLYQYRVDNDVSLTNRNYDIGKFSSVLYVIEKWYSYFDLSYSGETARGTMMRYFLSQHRQLLAMIGKLPAEMRRYALQQHTKSARNIHLQKSQVEFRKRNRYKI